MDMLNAIKALNQRAAREKWYYYCDPSLAFCDSLHDPLIKLWHTKADGRTMPRRSDLSPRDLKEFLRNIVLFQRDQVNPSHYIWRLIGTKVTEITGHHTGKSFEETLSPSHVERWVNCYDLVLAGKQPLRFLGRVHLTGREYLDADNLFVPLANDDDEPAFVMGLCHYTPRQSNDEQSWENQIASIPGALL
ncbi:MAG TPA: PAS domain-containing protein [Rhizomicrobium sp.]|nr:PAS domain-containing protein [Rhizomicrobium sp.]